MYPADNMRQARANILAQGIQQTNRYKIEYNSVQSGEFQAYPYAITLPGYGYDLIDHSLWAISRKIPFRRSNTEVELTFIVGNHNYGNYIYFWNNLLGNPKKNINKIKTADEIGGFAAKNGADANEANGAVGVTDNVTVDNTTQGNTPTEQSTGEYTIGFNIPELPDIGSLNKGTNARIGSPGEAQGWGGAAAYKDEIYENELTVWLLDENMETNGSVFVFEEAYISQISEVQLTSAETGYSPFKVSFRFTTMYSYS